MYRAKPFLVGIVAIATLLFGLIRPAFATGDPYEDLYYQVQMLSQRLENAGIHEHLNFARAIVAAQPSTPAYEPYYRTVFSVPRRGCVVVTVALGDQSLKVSSVQFEYGADPKFSHASIMDPRRDLSKIMFGSVTHRLETYLRGESAVSAFTKMAKGLMGEFTRNEYSDMEGQSLPGFTWLFEFAPGGGERVYRESIVDRCHPAAGGFGEFLLAMGGVNYESIIRRWEVAVRAEPCRPESLDSRRF